MLVALAVNLAVGAKIYLTSIRASDDKDTANANLALFSDALDKVRREYVDGTNLTYQQLVYSALKGMVNRLDPHSEFMDAEGYQELQDDTEGQFGGLGLEVTSREGYVTVVAPMEDTPGSRAGVLSGDRIVKINGKSVEKLALDDVVKQLRGEPGTKVVVTFQRPAAGWEKDFTLTRAVIQKKMVEDLNGEKDFPVDDDKIGYVRITQFGEKTSDELEGALRPAQGAGHAGADSRFARQSRRPARRSGGGCAEISAARPAHCLHRGPAVGGKIFRPGRRRVAGHPVVVLVNLGSASAAEIVTGCLQDCTALGKCQAVILGEKTFGKGSVQTIFPLDDGSALKLTVAKYYTPSHKVIHEHGITPDIVVPVTDVEEAALMVQRTPGGVESLPGKGAGRGQGRSRHATRTRA